MSDVKQNVKGGADEFVEIKVDRDSLKFELFTARDEKNPNLEKYNGMPVEGFLVAFLDMGERLDEETGEMKATQAFVLELTKPTKAINMAGEVVDKKIGDEVLLWPNAMLNQALRLATGVQDLRAMASHPSHMIKIRVTPIHREPIKGDAKKKMWRFKTEAVPRPFPRVGKNAYGILSMATPPAALLANGAPIVAPATAAAAS